MARAERHLVTSAGKKRRNTSTDRPRSQNADQREAFHLNRPPLGRRTPDSDAPGVQLTRLLTFDVPRRQSAAGGDCFRHDDPIVPIRRQLPLGGSVQLRRLDVR